MQTNGQEVPKRNIKGGKTEIRCINLGIMVLISDKCTSNAFTVLKKGPDVLKSG